MSYAKREEAGLHRWSATIDGRAVDYGGADQGGNDTNYRNQQPKPKQQKKGDTSWKPGAGYSPWGTTAWPSTISVSQWGTSAGPIKGTKASEWRD